MEAALYLSFNCPHVPPYIQNAINAATTEKVLRQSTYIPIPLLSFSALAEDAKGEWKREKVTKATVSIWDREASLLSMYG